MSKIKFPDFLEVCLLGSQYRPAIRTFADEVGELISANKTPFFPEYTDHGVDHLNAVLASAVNLIPENVKKKREHGKPKWFTDADATVLIGAVLLHDIAMHLRPAGFLELIDPDSKFGRNSDDKPWHELWADYQHEARRFTDETLTNLLGRKQSGGFKWVDLPEDPSSWNANTERIVGEFIRRHHPRIAHDIAHCGFPGHHDNQPLLQLSKNVEIRSLEDQIGFTARSHGIDLRVASKYLIDVYDNPRRHNGAATLYIMGLLRIADYLQIERDRAPLILLNLDQPQSPVSLAEWHKHRAVLRSNAGKSSEARSFKINPDLNHSTFIQLRTLLKKMQRELDQTNAVLAQELCDEETKRLRLSLRSIESDLDNRRFLDSLPYFPEETRFAADPNILPLLVEPLYGDNPSVGVRELLQNAVDAVRERRVLCEKNGTTMEPIAEADDPDTDILVDYIESPEGQWTLRIQDRGIGMTPETIRDFYLKAGVSYRNSDTWSSNFLSAERKPIVARIGRFGIGAFATFLLGDRFTVETRHYHDSTGNGHRFEASLTERSITILRVPQQNPIGTTVTIPLSSTVLNLLNTDDDIPNLISERWYTHKTPRVVTRIKASATDRQVIECNEYTPHDRQDLTEDWNAVDDKRFSLIAWRINDNQFALIVNGFGISNKPASGDDLSCRWFTNKRELNTSIFSKEFLSFSAPPQVLCIDKHQEIPLLTNRFSVRRLELPFFTSVEQDCRHSILSFLLIHGPNSPAKINSRSGLHQLQRSEETTPWVATADGFLPYDAWLLSVVSCDSVRVHLQIYEEYSYSIDTSESRLSPLNNSLHAHDNTATRVGLTLLHHSYLRNEVGYEGDGVSCIEVRAKHEVERRLVALMPNCTCLNWEESPSTGATWAELQKLESESPTEWDIYEESFYLFGTITFKDIPEAPQSMIARVWNETIGPNVIPYDPDARRHLIEQARKHPDMRRHLEKWERLGPTGEPLSAD